MALPMTTMNDILYGYRDGGVQDGTPTLAGAVIDITCLIKSHSNAVTGKFISQAGICANDDQQLFTRSNGTETFEAMYLPTVGPTFKALLGHYIEITETIASLTPVVRIGVVSAWTKGGSDDGNDLENVTIIFGVVGV